MHRFYFLLTFCFFISVSSLYGQATLPDFTLKNTDGKISVFWLNSYKKPVKGISVQRSYDSTKNFFSIASILNPQNSVNGFTDSMAPYNKMYYRFRTIMSSKVKIYFPANRRCADIKFYFLFQMYHF